MNWLASPMQLSRGSLDRRSMPRAEKQVNCSVDITIMKCIAITAGPTSLIQSCPTFRPGNASTCGAGLRRKSFIHFLIGCAFSNGFVRKHETEGRPASIRNRLRHAGLGEGFCVDIANSNVIKLFHDAIRELVECVFSTVGNLCVNVSHLTSFISPLCQAEFLFKRSVMPWIINFLAGRESCKFFEPKINANIICSRPFLGLSDFDNEVEEPIPLSITRKARPIFDLAFRQRPAIEHPECSSMKSECVTLPTNVSSLKWHPTKRLKAPISKVRPVPLRSRLTVFFANCADCGGMQVQFFARPSSQINEIKCSGPFLAPLKSVFLCIVAKIPNKIYRPGLLVKQAIKRFNTVLVNNNHHTIIQEGSVND